MIRLIRIAIAAALAGGCSSSNKPAEPGPRPPVSTAELWAWAPDDTRIGVVVAPGSGAAIERGIATLAGSLREHGVGRDELAIATGVLSAIGWDVSRGAPDGIDPDGPLAWFVTGEGLYSLSRLADRDAADELNGEVGGGRVCAARDGLVRCAPSAEALAVWTPGATAPTWPEELQGDVEIYAKVPGLPPPSPLWRGVGTLRAGVAVERGAIAVTYELAADVKPAAPPAPGRLVKNMLASEPAGALVISEPVVALMIRVIPREVLDRTVSGVSLRALTGEVRGPIVAAMRPGGSGGAVSIGLRGDDALRSFLSTCEGSVRGVLELSREGGRCLVTTHWGAAPATLELLVRDGALHVSSPEAPPAPAAAPAVSPVALDKHPWFVALWFRGIARDLAPQNPVLMSAAGDSPLATLRWIAAHLTELGLGARRSERGLRGFVKLGTVWRNPPALVAALEPLLARAARGDRRATDAVEALAIDHPKTSLARDVALGRHGVAAVTLAVVISQFVRAAIEIGERAREPVLDELDAHRAAMCACRDKPCAERVSAEFEAWLERTERRPGSREQQERARSLAEAYTRCMMEAMKTPPSTSP